MNTRLVRTMISVVGLLILIVLVACGGAAEAPVSVATSEPESAAAEPIEAAAEEPAEEAAESSDAGFPVTITHKFGETVIPAAPQRVVSIGFTEQDALYALGIQPVAIRYWYGDAPNSIFPWAEEAAAGHVPTVLNITWGEINYEELLELQPDLISGVVSGITQEEFEQLSLIAPTTAQSGDYIDFGMPWQEATQMIGDSVGKSAEATALIAEVEGKFQQARADNPQFEGKTIAVAYSNGDGTYGFYTDQDGRARFFTDLGFVIPEEMVEIAGDSFYANLSQERVDLLDTDVLLFLGLQFLEGGRESIENDPFIQSLDAYKEGRVVFVPLEYDDALQFGTVLSLPYALEGLLPELQRATGAE